MEKCINCTHKCAEYNNSITCEKNYYEWLKVKEQCDEKEENENV